MQYRGYSSQLITFAKKTKMVKVTKIVHVYFKLLKKDDYLGSFSAIYDSYTKDDVGYTLGSLMNLRINEDKPFENDKVIIRVSFLKQKSKTKRGE